MSFPVWQYWEGPMPAYISLCHETVRRHYPERRLLDPESFDALWEHDRDLQIAQLGPYHRSDFLRAYVLRHHGGLWLDSDFVLLRPIAELPALPSQVTFAGYRIDGGGFTNNLMFSRPGDPVLADFYARICEHLREWRPIGWLELGSDALAGSIAAHPRSVHELSPDRVCPIPWHQARRFETGGDAAQLVGVERWGVMLANASMSDELRAKSRETVLEDSSLLSDLLRKALA